ncbi:MAG: hypothetical protein AAFN93_06150 [Bacteroidota bacterium]
MKYLIISILVLTLFQKTSEGTYILVGYDNTVPIFEEVKQEGITYSLSDKFEPEIYKEIGKQKDILLVQDDLLVIGQSIGSTYNIQLINKTGFAINIDDKPVQIGASNNLDVFYFLSHDYVIHRVEIGAQTVKSLALKSDYIAIRNKSLYYTEESDYGPGFVNLIKASVFEPSKKKTLLENLYTEGLEISSNEEFIACTKSNNGQPAYTLLDCKGKLIDQIDMNLVKTSNLYPLFKGSDLFYYKPKGLKVFSSAEIFTGK